MTIIIKVWWVDESIQPAKYEYSTRELADEHWEGFLKQSSVRELCMYYQKGQYIKGFKFHEARVKL